MEKSEPQKVGGRPELEKAVMKDNWGRGGEEHQHRPCKQSSSSSSGSFVSQTFGLYKKLQMTP